MLENIRTEIIYYTIPTDFELEFNIRGCCNMRLLTCSESDENKLLSVMARAISRNKIVIITGPLTNDIVEKIASAIGYQTDILDTAELFDTNSSFNEIIKGSVPLITEDAILGGCIVESGPQSLILVSSEKSVQREIMKNLIEPYIRAVSELENDIEEDNEEENILPVEQENTIDYIQSVPIEVDDTQNQEDEVIEQPEESDVQQYVITADDVFQDEPQKSNSSFTVATLIVMILLLIILGVLGYFLIISPILNDISIVDNFKNIFSFLVN